jgi:Domain of unknown function (DUF4394)
MSKCLRITIATGLMAAALTATAQEDARVGGFGDNNLGGCGAAGFFQRFTLRVVGLTSDQRLVCFNEYFPRNASTIGSVSGLSGGDTSLVGIDYRVQDGKLYGSATRAACTSSIRATRPRPSSTD